jgi:xylulokinase
MKQKLLLGYDIGSSSVKASVITADGGELAAAAFSPSRELKIGSPKFGWAEQHPDTWWEHVIICTKKIISELKPDSYEILAIGISYQMHGLVMIDKNLEAIHPSIIWCDSRAVEIGNDAFQNLGSEYCLGSCLNSPGNFTASKLKWVMEYLPDIYGKIYKIMLPGDYIALKLTGEVYTTISGLSEGIFWDFKQKKLSDEIINYFKIDKKLIADLVPTFETQGNLSDHAANELGLKAGIPISYRAGDQPNNALSLNVLNPGEVAATAGTSGVIYGVTDKNLFDPESRVNAFAHVNYTKENPINGVLLCINGTGIQYSWLKNNIFDDRLSYEEMNNLAADIKIGADDLLCHPFGNGAERILNNNDINCSFSGINFNAHTKGHLIRAAQEGIAFAFKYGFDIMKEMGMEFNIIKAGNSNLFQSKIFREAFVNTCNVNLEIYNTDGSQGAARGAGIGIGYYSVLKDAFKGLKIIDELHPKEEFVKKYGSVYNNWKPSLLKMLG